MSIDVEALLQAANPMPEDDQVEQRFSQDVSRLLLADIRAKRDRTKVDRFRTNGRVLPEGIARPIPRKRGLPWLSRTAAAALVVAAIVGAVWIFNGQMVAVDPASPEAVAESFMEAWTAGDGEAVAALFGAVGTFENSMHLEPEMLSALHDWYRALGWEFGNQACITMDTEGGDGSTARCQFTFENDVTRALGWAPLTDEFQFEIVGGEITNARFGFTYAYGYRHIWHVFRSWVVRNHPEDISEMYVQYLYSYPLLDQASTALWERYTEEFLDSAEALAAVGERYPMAEYLARAHAICARASLELEATVGLFPGDADPGLTRWSATAAQFAEQALAELQQLTTPERMSQWRLQRFYEDSEELIELLRGLAAGKQATSDVFWAARQHVDLGVGCPVSLP